MIPNIQGILQLMGGNNPKMMQILSNAQSICNGKSEEQIKSVVLNMCKQSGLDVNSVVSQFNGFMHNIGINDEIKF